MANNHINAARLDDLSAKLDTILAHIASLATEAPQPPPPSIQPLLTPILTPTLVNTASTNASPLLFKDPTVNNEKCTKKSQSEGSFTTNPTSAHLSFTPTVTNDDDTRQSQQIITDPCSTARKGSSTVATSTFSNRRVASPPMAPSDTDPFPSPPPKPPNPSFWRTTVKPHVAGETTRPQPPSIPVLPQGPDTPKSGSSTKESSSVPHSTHSLPLVTPQDSQGNLALFDLCDAIHATSSLSKNLLFCALVLLTIPHEHFPPSVSLPFFVNKSQPFQKSTIRVIAFQATAVGRVLSSNSRTSPNTQPTSFFMQRNRSQLLTLLSHVLPFFSATFTPNSAHSPSNLQTNGHMSIFSVRIKTGQQWDSDGSSSAWMLKLPNRLTDPPPPPEPPDLTLHSAVVVSQLTRYPTLSSGPFLDGTVSHNYDNSLLMLSHFSQAYHHQFLLPIYYSKLVGKDHAAMAQRCQAKFVMLSWGITFILVDLRGALPILTPVISGFVLQYLVMPISASFISTIDEAKRFYPPFGLGNIIALLCYGQTVTCFSIMGLNSWVISLPGMMIPVTWLCKLTIPSPSPNEYYSFLSNLSSTTATITMLPLNQFINKHCCEAAARITPTVVLPTGVGFLLLGGPLVPALVRIGITPLLAVVSMGAMPNIFSKRAKFSLFDTCKAMACLPLDADTNIKRQAENEVVHNPLGKSRDSHFLHSMLLNFGLLATSTPNPMVDFMVFLANFSVGVDVHQDEYVKENLLNMRISSKMVVEAFDLEDKISLKGSVMLGIQQLVEMSLLRNWASPGRTLMRKPSPRESPQGPFPFPQLVAYFHSLKSVGSLLGYSP